MGTVPSKTWMNVSRQSLLQSKLLKVNFDKNKIYLEFSKLGSVILWNPQRCLFNIRDKGHYALKMDESERDKEYWTLRVEEILSNKEVSSVYVSINDTLILSFKEEGEDSTKLTYQLFFMAPSGVMLKI